ncbi:MAG: HNH endonuclease [Solobacterium sp.]|nr:HNH endonuclease [Erysipelotrichaceae bacterium]MBR3350139.1 HNH endonuclease [Solobacterium sp.]
MSKRFTPAKDDDDRNFSVEANTNRRFPFDRFPEFRQVSPYKYQAVHLSKNEAKSLVRRLRLRGFTVIWYRNIWAKGDNYRRIFLESQGETCRCVYCGKFFPKKSITVDHVIPADLAKRSPYIRWKLERKGYKSIDDPRNLVAACYRCNNRKKNLNLFRYRFLAKYGRYDWFWRLRTMLIILAVIIVLLTGALIVNYATHHSFAEIVSGFENFITNTLLNVIDTITGEKK